MLLRSKQIITKDKPAGLALWALPTTLSLDAPLIALCWQFIFAKTFLVQLSWLEPTLLFLTVWLIYAFDRLLDGFKLDLSKPHSSRHAFYVEHRVLMSFLCLVVAVIAAWLSFRFLSPSLFSTGLFTLALCALYGLGIHKFKAFLSRTKEVQISLLFALGSSLVVWVQGFSWGLLVMVLGFATLCFMNCLVIALIEKQLDAGQGALSLAQQSLHLEAYLRVGLRAFALLSFLFTFLLSSAFCFALGLAALALLFVNKQSQFPTEVCRVLADAALLTPLIVLWV